ncbi:MAG TPA: serine/threonine-protein kinase [Pirellulales bacterium]|jgi:serine/threonine-protein kinase|nr:serine/threonine-protein kinase [Pirellulales bacterium]
MSASQSAAGPPLNPPAAHDAREERLARLLEQMSAAQRAGAAVDYRRFTATEPDLADEVRQLWGAIMLAEAVGQRAQRSADSSSGASRAGASAEPVRAEAPRANLTAAVAVSAPRQWGDYEILEEIGRGGMGVVYKARQISLNRLVALKMILRGDVATAAELSRFRAEAEAAARLEHPNIVPVYEVGEIEGKPYFSMKYVAGSTLAKRLAEGPVAPREAARLLAKVCRAIHFAHQHGVLHRDLKPSNILLDEQGEPHVTDFGLAKRFGDSVNLLGFERAASEPAAELAPTHLTQTGAILGTPSYIAPEQAAGSRGVVGPACDIYSLGTVLYAMLTGRPPFQAASPLDTLMMVLEQDPLPPRLVNAKADRELEMIALRALQKPPELRYPTAAAFADDLQAYLQGEPIAARSGGISQILSRLFRETHHATVLESWGLLWMWHSVVLLALCVSTNWLQLSAIRSPWPYLLIWAGGLLVWAPIFWALRRRAGPVTFVERQIAHAWAASIIGSILLFFLEMILGLPVLTLSPVLGILSGMVFLFKAGILTGAFYVEAAALFSTALVMALFPTYGLTIFGFVSAACFFIPGWKYHRQRRAG